MEETELDVGSASEEMETIDLKIARGNPKPFTIESLIGRGQASSEERGREESLRQRELLYQQHCLATATGALPGKRGSMVFLFYVEFCEPVWDQIAAELAMKMSWVDTGSV